MLGKSGITKVSGVSVNQILATPNLQYSVSIIVGNSGVQAGSDGKKIIKAGTPLSGSLEARTTPFVSADSSGDTSNATVILLHDVDVTEGNANGTALVFGFVDLNKLDLTTKALIDAKTKKALNKITFIA